PAPPPPFASSQRQLVPFPSSHSPSPRLVLQLLVPQLLVPPPPSPGRRPEFESSSGTAGTFPSAPPAHLSPASASHSSGTPPQSPQQLSHPSKTRRKIRKDRHQCKLPDNPDANFGEPRRLPMTKSRPC